MPPTPTPTPPPPTPPPTPPPPPPTPPPPPPTPPPPPPTPPPPPPTPPPTYYAYVGTDCSGNNITIYTLSSIFSISDTAYSGADVTYSGYFIYSGNAYSYTSGNGTTITSVGHNVFECAGNVITIYTNNISFNVSDTAYTNACLTTFFNGAIVIGGNNYKYSNGVASQSYAYVGTLCNGSPVTIYTSQSSFSLITAFADQCLTTTYSGFFIYSGTVYYYQNGSGVQYSYAHVGTDCSINPVTIYTNSTTWSAADTAYSDQCLAATYSGYFLYNSLVYSYSGGSASISSCPTPPPPTPTPTPPPPTPTPTPPPSPAPSYTNPNILKADIHSSYATGSGAWQTYRANVTGLFVSNSGANRADYRDHLIREFNRKISILNQPTGLFIRPFDNGFRFTGVSIQ